MNNTLGNGKKIMQTKDTEEIFAKLLEYALLVDRYHSDLLFDFASVLQAIEEQKESIVGFGFRENGIDSLSAIKYNLKEYKNLDRYLAILLLEVTDDGKMTLLEVKGRGRRRNKPYKYEGKLFGRLGTVKIKRPCEETTKEKKESLRKNISCTFTAIPTELRGFLVATQNLDAILGLFRLEEKARFAIADDTLKDTPISETLIIDGYPRMLEAKWEYCDDDNYEHLVYSLSQ